MTPPRPPDGLTEFTTDGCSLWPDGNYRSCCEAHDAVYWRGGSAQERLEADLELARCVAKAAGMTMAMVMFLGVRFGGMPILPARRFRWGYGRRYRDSWWYGRQTV